MQVQYSLSFSFGFSPEENMWLFSYQMVRYAHQLVSNCVCLLCGAEEEAWSAFLELFLQRTAACHSRNRCYESSESEVKQ